MPGGGNLIRCSSVGCAGWTRLAAHDLIDSWNWPPTPWFLKWKSRSSGMRLDEPWPNNLTLPRPLESSSPSASALPSGRCPIRMPFPGSHLSNGRAGSHRAQPSVLESLAPEIREVIRIAVEVMLAHRQKQIAAETDRAAGTNLKGVKAGTTNAPPGDSRRASSDRAIETSRSVAGHPRGSPSSIRRPASPSDGRPI